MPLRVTTIILINTFLLFVVFSIGEKINLVIVAVMLIILSACATEFEIASTEVPESVTTAYKNKYPGATDTEWEVEKKDGKLYFEAEFKINGKTKEAYFRLNGTFGKEEYCHA